MERPVTDPRKIVTDPLVLKRLAEENIAHIKYCLEGMKDNAEFTQAMDLVEKALKYAKTKPEMAIGYLIDVEPLIEQGDLQKAVSCGCGETMERRREFMEVRSKS